MGHSGGVSFPAYLQDMHEAWLKDTGNDVSHVDAGYDITSIMMTALAGGSPYANPTLFDPRDADSLTANSPLYDNNAMHDTLTALVDSITAIHDGTQWDTLYTKAKTKAPFTKETVSTEMAAIVTAAVKGATSVIEDNAAAQKGIKQLFSDDGSELIGYHGAEAIADASANDTILDTLMTTADTGSISVIMARAQVEVKAFVDLAISSAVAAGNSAVNDSEITAAVNAYENSRLNGYYRNLNRFTGGMADINAVGVSSFMMGVVSLNKDLANDVDIYEAQIRLQTYGQMVTAYMQSFMGGFATYLQNYSNELNTRMNAILIGAGQHAGMLQSIIQGYFSSITNEIMGQLSGQVTSNNVYNANDAQYLASSIQQMSNLMQISTSAKTQATAVNADINRIRITAQKEFLEETIQMGAQDGLWDLEVYRYGANVMAAISGAPSGTAAPSRASSMLGGAMTGAASGAMIGSAVPGIGTAIGAGVGAVVGAAGGAL